MAKEAGGLRKKKSMFDFMGVQEGEGSAEGEEDAMKQKTSSKRRISLLSVASRASGVTDGNDDDDDNMEVWVGLTQLVKMVEKLLAAVVEAAARDKIVVEVIEASDLPGVDR